MRGILDTKVILAALARRGLSHAHEIKIGNKCV